jgi:uncharacterized repeat protein (TIGR01451 family)
MKTNRHIFATGLLAIVALALFPRMAAAQEMKTLHGHVPAVVSQFNLQPTSKFPENTNINLAIGLPLRNTGELSNLLEQVYNPANPNYHHYLTPEQFTAQFGPSEDDYKIVANFAKVHNLAIIGTYSNRMLLDVQGKVSDIEKAFKVKLHTYHDATRNRDFYAPDTEPLVPSILPIQDVFGLDNYARPHPEYRLKPAALKPAASSGKSQAATGSGPGGDYIGNDFRNAYVPGTSLNGLNQTVALVEFDGYLASDIQEYESLAGRTNIPLQNVLLDGFPGSPTGDGGEVEVSLDIEMLVSMAPALAQIVVYEGNPFNFIPDDVLNRIASDDTASQISSSWSWSGGPSTVTDQIFQEMDLQGQTYYNAVGDEDAFTPGANSVNGVDNPLIDHAPSDSPYITQVGGTTLTMNGAGASYSSETVWNWDVRFGPAYDGIGTCGGISSFYSIPTWQTNINMTPPQGSTSFRNMPDVALTADDVFVIADGGFFYIGTGGTSCAAPLWAGFTALVNQQSLSNGSGPMGFINPALYAIAETPNYTNCFHDITTGNNTWSQSPNLFNAITNYDLCTGLGTPNGTNLIDALTATAGTFTNVITHISPPPSPYGTVQAALNGGNPNGNWYLFIQDDLTFNSGVISNGWMITLTTANPVGYVADDYLTMSAAPTNLLVGYDANISIGVTNYGPSVSSNVVVSDTLPLNFTLINTSTGSGTVLSDGQTVIWNVGTLPVSSGALLNLTIAAPATIEQDVIDSATVTAATPDQNSSDDFAFATFNVISATPPSISGSKGPGGKFELTVSGTDLPVVIQTSTNLINWVNIATNTPAFTFTDTVSAPFPDRFYRALYQQE